MFRSMKQHPKLQREEVEGGEGWEGEGDDRTPEGEEAGAMEATKEGMGMEVMVEGGEGGEGMADEVVISLNHTSECSKWLCSVMLMSFSLLSATIRETTR